MNLCQTARSHAKREISADRYISKCPWIARPPKLRIALIQITYALTDGEGERLSCRTWTTGTTAYLAMRRWLSRRPLLPQVDASYTVATESKRRRYAKTNPGKRVEVTDTLAEYMAATCP